MEQQFDSAPTAVAAESTESGSWVLMKATIFLVVIPVGLCVVGWFFGTFD